MMDETIPVAWLLDSDPSIRWQVLRDIVGADDGTVTQEKQKVATQGWGSRLLSYQDKDGRWGGQLYNNKWLSTTYTLLLLRRMGLESHHDQAQLACKALLDGGFRQNGSICYAKSKDVTDHGVTGMILALLSYFDYPDDRVQVIAGYLISQQMENGSWEPYPGNQETKYTFAATLLCLDALWEYEKRYPEQYVAVREAQARGREFLLEHRIYQHQQTKAIVDPKFTLFSFPPRWYYDVLTALDYLRCCHAERDDRFCDAVGLLKKKQNPDGTWNLQNRHTGKTFFEMETVGKPSRWNTLRAIRVLKWWENSS